MGEHGWFDKRWMYEESFRTPMVMRYPALIKPHTQINAKVVNADIAPTLLELASVKNRRTCKVSLLYMCSKILQQNIAKIFSIITLKTENMLSAHILEYVMTVTN
ncbi:sulfatase-like hydrolase/transferase [Sphingobacterium sp. KU25419]|nr:sulfatase-like hydrolase/transferase [Sphingobacterium sp. KU25419]